MNPSFELAGLGCERGPRRVLAEIAARFAPGEFVGLCGLNGAGKSTLLETMAGLLRGYTGAARFAGRELREWPARELAARVSFLPQSAGASGTAAARFTGLEVVRTGRYPFARGWSYSAEDAAICESALRRAGCEALAGRFINELSGGERQRVLFAAALAQQPRALLLDEPGAFVDLPHQIHMFRALRELCQADAEPLLAIAATHDFNLAAAFCSRIVLLDGGRIVADGEPAAVLASAGFQRLFGGYVRVEGNRVHYEI